MPRRYRTASELLFFLERLIAFSEFLDITYTKTTILIGRSGPRVGPMNQRGSGAAAARHFVNL
jgi:hypothetical protein